MINGQNNMSGESQPGAQPGGGAFGAFTLPRNFQNIA